SVQMAAVGELSFNPAGSTVKVFRIGSGGGDQTQTLTLLQGWNLVSFANQPVNPLVDAILDASVRSGPVWAYDPVTGYTAASTVVAKRGYWVYAVANAALDIKGQTVSGNITLNQGWNLVGFTADHNLPNPLPAGVVVVYGYNTATDAYETVSAGGAVMTGKGYWIYSTAPATIPAQ
ncbi:MAG: hypothetical protein WC708_19985, partial [Lentisphaeria bacterium]